MSDISSLRNSFNNLNFKNSNDRAEIKREVISSLANDGKIDQTEKKSLLEKFKTKGGTEAQSQELGKVLDGLNQQAEKSLKLNTPKTINIMEGRPILQKLNAANLQEAFKDNNFSTTEVQQLTQNLPKDQQQQAKFALNKLNIQGADEQKIINANQDQAGSFVKARLKNEDFVFVGMNTKAKEDDGSYGKNVTNVDECIKGDTEFKSISEKKQVSTNATFIRDTSTEAKSGKVKIDGIEYNLRTDQGINAFTKSLNLNDSAKEQKLSSFLRSIPNEDAHDEYANLAKVFADGEKNGEMPSRLVVSGHNRGDGNVWGDYNGEFDFKKLTELSKVFPEAASQVEDLAISACNSGFENDIAEYKNAFPNIKTIMAFTGTGSTTEQAKTQLQNWEKQTRSDNTNFGANDLYGQVATNANDRNSNITVWTNDGTVAGKTDIKRLRDRVGATHTNNQDLSVKLEFIDNICKTAGKELMWDSIPDPNSKGSFLAHSVNVVGGKATGMSLENRKENDGTYKLNNYIKNPENAKKFVEDLNSIKEIPDNIKKQIIDLLQIK